MYLAPVETRKGVGYTGTGVRDGCEFPCGSGESNPGLLEEQLVLLGAELSLQPLLFTFQLRILIIIVLNIIWDND